MYRPLTLAAMSLAAAVALTPNVVSAQYYGRGYDNSTRGRVYDRQSANRAQAGTYRQNYRCDKGTGGTLLGAIAGGLLGNAAVGRHGDRTAGTIGGAGVGALLGRAADRNC